VRLRALGLKLGRFGVVGAISTLLYLGASELAVRWFGLPVEVANTLSIFLSGAWGYVGHYYVTFRADTAHGTGLARFLLLFVLGYVVSSAIVFLNQRLGLPPESGTITASIVLPVMNFILMQLWVFARHTGAEAPSGEGT
jgi:putative flippase GtrA